VTRWRPEDAKSGWVWLLAFFAAAGGAYVLLHFVSPQLFALFDNVAGQVTDLLEKIGFS
jgi:hypothetical protein